MTAIDVGRGDALLLTYPNGKRMLVDAGGSYTARTYVVPYLAQKGITHLDAIVCTHEHWDHIDGLTELLKDGRFTVDEAYDAGFPMVHNLQTANNRERASIDAYLMQLKDRHVNRVIVQAGDTIDVGRDSASQKDAATFVLSPNAALTASLQKRVKDNQGTSNHAAINENSLVLRIGYEQVHFLLAGDTSLPGNSYADAAMLADPIQSQHLSSDVLKLGHHGFSTPDDAFYSVVKPRYVVMTFGPQLRTSEPYCEGLHQGTQNFDYFKGALWSTCDKGTVTVTADGTPNGIHIQSEASSVPQGCCCRCVNDHPPREDTPADVAT
ncbi:MAG: MBL fold metallo-hydrolase [Euryarchaeota archaeon]|nr:MBL fold metallo-hydrolase [Euryarchaeota archaeon]